MSPLIFSPKWPHFPGLCFSESFVTDYWVWIGLWLREFRPHTTAQISSCWQWTIGGDICVLCFPVLDSWETALFDLFLGVFWPPRIEFAHWVTEQCFCTLCQANRRSHASFQNGFKAHKSQIPLSGSRHKNTWNMPGNHHRVNSS